MEWNSLKASDKSRIIRTAVEHGITDLEEIKSFWNDSIDGNQYPDGGTLVQDASASPDNPPMGRANPDNWKEYMDWAYAASERLSKEWDEPESFIFFDMLNNNNYDYKAFYDEDPQRAWEWLTSPEGSHFDDVGKTVYHPSFSNESMYSANNYGDMGTGANPNNIEGPAWNDNNQLIDQEGNVVFDENTYAEGGPKRKLNTPNYKSSVTTDYKYYFDKATGANRYPPQFIDKEYEAVTGKKYTGHVKNTVEKSPVGKQALHEYLTESGKDFNEYEFEDYTNRRTYPNMYEVYDADKNFVTKALERENIIPLDYSKTITLSNAGTLTGAKIPTSLLEIVKNKADSLKESPYTLLGIMGKETTFGKNNPYTFNVTKEDYINNSLPEEGIKAGETYYRSVSDLSNNHHYFISPVRGEINQVYRNTGMEFPKTLEYGHPDYLLNDNPLPTPEFAKWFNTRNMKTASVQSFEGPAMDDWGSMLQSYNDKLYANMPEIYEKIETLKKSPELRKYFGQ